MTLNELHEWMIKDLEQQIEMMESGALRTYSVAPNGEEIDTTQNSIARSLGQMSEIRKAMEYAKSRGWE